MRGETLSGNNNVHNGKSWARPVTGVVLPYVLGYKGELVDVLAVDSPQEVVLARLKPRPRTLALKCSESTSFIAPRTSLMDTIYY
jgi:hypothetical protein